MANASETATRVPRPGPRVGGDRLRLEAVLWVGGVRLGLWGLPFDRLRRLLARIVAVRRAPREQRPSPEQIGMAVDAASRAVPRATCLVRALAAHAMLLRAGHDVQVHFGVPSVAGPAFEAHAWVEVEGRVVVGGDVSRQLALGTLPPR